uniref:Uncharacterized protein n=1 Tax=Salarias fasciatus TaxID=181472 RepID=A0A672HRT4_SALFA
MMCPACLQYSPLHRFKLWSNKKPCYVFPAEFTPGVGVCGTALIIVLLCWR